MAVSVEITFRYADTLSPSSALNVLLVRDIPSNSPKPSTSPVANRVEVAIRGLIVVIRIIPGLTSVTLAIGENVVASSRRVLTEASAVIQGRTEGTAAVTCLIRYGLRGSKLGKKREEGGNGGFVPERRGCTQRCRT